MANKKFTSIKNDYCITFDQFTEISEVEDDKKIKAQGFDFVNLAGIQDIV
jgi:hypothetical protein